MKRRFFALLLIFGLAAGLLSVPAQAALSTEYPEDTPAEISISQEEIEELARRLETVKRDNSGTFEIIDALSGTEEIRSTDYTVSSLNVWNGVAYVSDADAAILDEVLAEAGLADASDAEKLAWATEWIHNNLLYDGYHTGSYVYSCFEEAGGQCNVYNGALCALAAHLGYQVQLVRGYRGSTGSQTAHWWGELVTDGEPLVLETGNTVDGEWYFLASTYEETHSSGRDYIKCNQYAYSGEPFEYLGAAAYPMSPSLTSEGTTLRARVWKGADYTVSQVGLLFGQGEEALTELASEAVGEEYNQANDSRGFSVSYRLEDYGVTPQAGETYWYAFYAVVDGVTCTSETVSLIIPAQEEVPVAAQLQEEQSGILPLLLICAGVVLLLFVIVVLLRISALRKRRRRKARMLAQRRAAAGTSRQKQPIPQTARRSSGSRKKRKFRL